MGVWACVNCGSPITTVGTPFASGNVASNCGGNVGTAIGSAKFTSAGPFAVRRTIGNGVCVQPGHCRSPMRCTIAVLSAMFCVSSGDGVGGGVLTAAAKMVLNSRGHRGSGALPCALLIVAAVLYG